MAHRDDQVVRTPNKAAPYDYLVPQDVELILRSVRVKYTDNSAASDWLPCVDLISDSGHRIARCADPNVKVTAGDDADVTWFPGVKPAVGAQGAHLIDLVSFNPAGSRVEIVSTDINNPTLIVSSNAVVYDGATNIRIEFFAGGVDLDQRNFGGLGRVSLELYLDGVGVGLVLDWNVWPGTYGQIPCYVAAFDKPSAGTHTYDIRGTRTVSGGSGPGQSFVYGAQLDFPHVTRSGFMDIQAID